MKGQIHKVVTKREWLIEQGLAKGEKGRFSAQASAALDKAIAEGVVFSDPETKPAGSSKPVVTQEFDAKKVRKWATAQGIALGVRGRIPADIVQKYLDSNPASETAVVDSPDVPAPAARQRVRTESVAWGFARRAENDPQHISEPLVAISNCGRCGEGISFCICTNGPYVPSYLTNTEKATEPALLLKPAI